MKTTIVHLIALVTAVSCVWCCSGHSSVELRRAVRQFESSRIELPSSVIKIEKGVASYDVLNVQGFVYVVYYSPDECTSCAINHMTDNSRLFDLADSTKAFVPLVIMTPTEKADENVLIEELQVMDPGFPVYIDRDSDLSKKVPSDRRLHSFLLDESGRPVLVGNASRSIELEKLLLRYLQQ